MTSIQDPLWGKDLTDKGKGTTGSLAPPENVTYMHGGGGFMWKYYLKIRGRSGSMTRIGARDREWLRHVEGGKVTDSDRDIDTGERERGLGGKPKK